MENKRKLNLLKYCESLNEPETLLDISQVKDISMAQLERFTKFTGVFFTKCQERLKNINSISQEYFCVVVQYYIRFYLESKNTKNKEILNSKMQKTSSSYEYVALESKIKLLESQIATMEDENRERNATINSFLKEMNDMLQVHEQKCKEFKF